MKNTKPAEPDPNQVEFYGTVYTVTHRNDETGFTVFTVKTLVTGTGDYETVRVSGTVLDRVEPGRKATVRGRKVLHPQYGLQVKAKGVSLEDPDTQEGLIRYLGSGFIKGLGPKTARRIVERFGKKTLSAIEIQPAEVAQIQGIGKKRAGLIQQAWVKHKEIDAVMQFLKNRNLGPQRAYAIYNAYKDRPGGVIKAITDDPYRLSADVRGIGFKLADEIASTMAIDNNDIRRIRAGVNYVLETATQKGHCGLPITEFYDLATELLCADRRLIADVIDQEIAANRILTDLIETTWCAFTPAMHKAEGRIAEQLKRFTKVPVPWNIPAISADIAAVEKSTNRTLSGSQRHAVEVALTNKVSIITGGPGVGKTTTLDTILRILKNYIPTDAIRLAAPAGRAAKRMSEQTGLPAMTIHRLIGYGKRQDDNNRTEPEPDATSSADRGSNLEGCQYLVLDEASMIDVRLMQSLLDKLRFAESEFNQPPTGLLIVGDVDQLPSVGAGSLLRDLIDSNMLPVARLTQIFRQAASSQIITNAHRINRGEMPRNLPSGQTSDFFMWPYEEPSPSHANMTLAASLAEEVVDMVSRRMPQKLGLNPKTDIQILAPMRRGDLGTIALNKKMQSALLPVQSGAPSLSWDGWSYSVGDKVMQTSNNYEKNVFNGDQGFVADIDPKARQLTVQFDNSIVPYDYDELGQLTAAYAITIHKSQGSEYPAVVIPIVNAHYMMLARNLLYTGVTRGKQLVVVIGQRDAIGRAVRNDEPNRRWTRLRQLMCDKGFMHYEEKKPEAYIDPRLRTLKQTSLELATTA